MGFFRDIGKSVEDFLFLGSPGSTRGNDGSELSPSETPVGSKYGSSYN